MPHAIRSASGCEACARPSGAPTSRRPRCPSPALLSASILAAGLPELDRVAFGIGQPGEASVRVDLRVHFDRDASVAKLRGHLVEVADAEVDHPLEPPVAEVRRVLLERCEDRCPTAA